MIGLETFSEQQIATVNQMVGLAEDIVSEHYKMSQAQWLRNRYDVLTLAQLDESEIVHGPYAQIVRYSGQKMKSPLGSGSFDFYKICLQDHSILRALRENKGLRLDPFILYIVTHELIHVIRFGQFIQFFDAGEFQRAREEELVHQRTVDILKKNSMIGLERIFSFYRRHREKTV
jgi:hypothetical protein